MKTESSEVFLGLK